MADQNSILDDLHARAQAFDLFVAIDPDHFPVDPNAEIALLLEKTEEVARLRFGRHRHPEGEQNIFPARFAQHFVGNRLGRLRFDLALASRTKGAGHARPE